MSILHPEVLHFSLSVRKAFVVLNVRMSEDAVIGVPLFAITLLTITTLFCLLVGCVLYSPGQSRGIGSLEVFVALAQTTLGALK